MRWVPFPLHPDTPADGRPLTELFGGAVDVKAMMARLREVAGALDLPFGNRTHTYNSRLAQELGEWADHLGRGRAFRDAVYRAYFVDGRNIGRVDELLAVAAAAGLPPEGAETVLRERAYRAAVDAHWRRARGAGIRAVPTHRLRGRLREGFVPPPELARWVGEAVARRP